MSERVEDTPPTVGSTKRDAIAFELRRLIMAGEMPRGTRLQQDELAQRFRASITPVREALRDLESEGLVESEPHRGVRVASLGLDRLIGIYIARRLLEGHAVGRAASRMSPRDIAKSKALLADIVAAREAGDLTRARDLNHEFHFRIYEHSQLPGLVDEIARYWRMFPWDMILTGPENVEDAAEQHDVILAAIERGDAAAAAEAVGVHIREAFLAVVAHITGGEEALADPYDYDSD